MVKRQPHSKSPPARAAEREPRSDQMPTPTGRFHFGGSYTRSGCRPLTITDFAIFAPGGRVSFGIWVMAE